MEGKRSGKEFYQDFVFRFYLQVIGYYTREMEWVRRAMDKQAVVDVAMMRQAMQALPGAFHRLFEEKIANCERMLDTDKPLYEYVIAAVAAPHGFATTIRRRRADRADDR
ncbi:MAG: hypothetical protein GY801_46790 [bacterium]|nr:hypothetical protein [bacterium]